MTNVRIKYFRLQRVYISNLNGFKFKFESIWNEIFRFATMIYISNLNEFKFAVRQIIRETQTCLFHQQCFWSIFVEAVLNERKEHYLQDLTAG